MPFSRIINWHYPRSTIPADILRAKQLISAIDAGGIPLDPDRIVKIAEDIGLEVSRNAPMEVTIERIRLAVARFDGR